MAAATSKTTKKTTRKSTKKTAVADRPKANETAMTSGPNENKWPSGPHPALYSPEWKEYFRHIIIERRNEILKELGYLRESSLEMTTDSYSGDS